MELSWLDELPSKNKDQVVEALRVLWNYMRLEQNFEECDLILGCGCTNLDIPVRCAQLFKQGYGKKILFAGGLGKLTEKNFTKSEAEIYKDIAIKEGIKEEDILIENNSTNTGDNFRFAISLLEKEQIKYDRILIVHNSFSERRTLSSAKAIIKDIELYITSPEMSFDDYLKYLDINKEKAVDIISVIVGDVQRIVVYPQFGWQVENELPEDVIIAYNLLKNSGFDKYILKPHDIDCLIDKFGVKQGFIKNYFN